MYAEFIATLATSEIHHSRIHVGETTIIPWILLVLDVSEVELCLYLIFGMSPCGFAFAFLVSDLLDSQQIPVAMRLDFDSEAFSIH